MICGRLYIKPDIWEKLSLLLREIIHIFNTRLYVHLSLFSEEIARQKKIFSAVLPPLEEEHLQTDKRIFTYLS